MKNIFYLFFTLFALFACKEAETVGTGLFMTGTETDNTKKFPIDALPSSYALSATSSKVVDTNVEVTIAVDTTLVETYNAKNGTKLFPIPKGAWELGTTKLIIPAGKSLSSATSISIVDDSKFVDGRTYMIPVSIKQSSGNQEVIESCRTLFLKVSRTINFQSLDASRANMTHQFIIDNPVTELPVYTWEVKIYGYDLDQGYKSNLRICGFGGDENCSHGYNVTEDVTCDQNLIRMEDDAEGKHKMRINIPQTYLVSTTNFVENRWYSIAVVNDGSTLTLYVDGEKDCFTTVKPANYPVYGVQVGMPWNGYQHRQHFPGRLSEMRIWNKPLTPREIKSSMCGVDPLSEGLIGYWKMNEGEGSTFYDATPAKNHLYYKNGTVIDWANDENNKCVE